MMLRAVAFLGTGAMILAAMGGSQIQHYKVLLLSLGLLGLALLGAKSHAADLPRQQVIEQLQDWRQDLSQTQNLEAREKDLQTEFINRLIFQVERKYIEDSLSNFLIASLDSMALASNPHSEFYLHLKESLATLLEKNENPLEFIRAYTEFSGLQSPASTDEFAELRSYYDGRTMLQAQAMSLDEAAEFLENKEKEAAEFKSDLLDVEDNLLDQYKDFQQKVLL